MPALPGGELRLAEIETFDVTGDPGHREVTAYSIAGTSRNPTYFLMHEDAFFGLITPGFAILEAGFEAEDERLRGLAADYAARRFDDIQTRYARRYNGPVRIRDVRIFDAVDETLGEPVSVVVDGNRITAIEALDAAPADGETMIEGGGGAGSQNPSSQICVSRQSSCPSQATGMVSTPSSTCTTPLRASTSPRATGTPLMSSASSWASIRRSSPLRVPMVSSSAISAPLRRRSTR